MATTLNLISKQTVGSAGTNSITFSNIPQTFTDLKVVVSSRAGSGTASNDSQMTFNGSTTGYSSKLAYGSGATAGSGSNTGSYIYWAGGAVAGGLTASTFSNYEVYIPNYRSSNYKSVSVDGVTENNAAFGTQMIATGLWSNTAAITSITITTDYTPYAQYTTAYLYGISNSSTQNTSVPSGTGGDVITTDGTYWYHAFKYSGTFAPLKSLSADVLCIAGGAGGGNGGAGGGGGAGGYRLLTSQTFAAATNYTVTIGGGGAASANGNNSSIIGGAISISSTGGGRGAGATVYPVSSSGGSGGGGGYDYQTIGTGNAGGYTPVEGYNGGSPAFAGGGGGGAGAVGTSATWNGSSGTGGNGGSGSNSASSWASATATGVSGYYAGGGGGGGDASSRGIPAGTGGAGGGGQGEYTTSQSSVAGTVNTGSGGGGSSSRTPYTSAAGGSGIVIVRYAI